MTTPELLAPAGELRSVYAAVEAGANAVYVGVREWNARARAQNLTLHELEDAIRYCYPRGVRVYLALNTLLSDDELSFATELVISAYQIGIQAVIVQDPGLISRIRESLPELPMHASTQMNLFRINDYHRANELGISRIILPRELSLDQIETRVNEGKQNNIESEVFIHGALCVSHSGLCLFSAMNGSGERSGNRGQCAQPCREEYEIFSSEGGKLRKGRLFSLRDQSAMPLLDELIRIGVHCFKIEGRMRDPDYVRTVVRAYRFIIDASFAGKTISQEESKRLNDDLLLAFNRGGKFACGYISDRRSDLAAGEYAGKFGIRIGEVRDLAPMTGTLELSTNDSIDLAPGDVVSVRQANQEAASFPIGKLRYENQSIFLKGLHPDSLTRLKPGMDVFLARKAFFDNLPGTDNIESRTSVDIRLEQKPGHEDDTVRVTAETRDLFDRSYSVNTDYVLPADYSGPPISEGRISEQFSRSANTPFRLANVYIGEGLSLRVPVSFINRLRRDILSSLESAVVEDLLSNRRSAVSSADAATGQAGSMDFHEFPGGMARCLTAIEYISLKMSRGALYDASELYIFSVYDVAEESAVNRIGEMIRNNPDAGIFIRIPGAYGDSQSAWIGTVVSAFRQRFQGSFRAVIGSGRYNGDFRYVLSHQANIFNSESLREIVKDRPAGFFLSEELSDEKAVSVISKSRSFINGIPLFVCRYGPVEWMQSMFCPLGQNKPDCHTCARYPFSIVGSFRDNPLRTFLLYHPEFCVSELFGPRKHERSDSFINLLKTMKIDMIQTIRVSDESTERIAEIITRYRN